MENIKQNQKSSKKIEYAGFGLRFVALVIDIIIICGVILVVAAPFIGQRFGQMERLILEKIFKLLMFLFVWLYFAWMESSEKQATFGKQIVGIQVTDEKGNRISFDKATARFFGKGLSGLIFYIGFFMAAFTEKKQALHDMLAGCLVIKKPNS